jgi:hypothetical protein
MDPSNIQSPRLGRRSTLGEESYERVTHSPSGRAIPLRVQIDSVLTKIAECKNNKFYYNLLLILF